MKLAEISSVGNILKDKVGLSTATNNTEMTFTDILKKSLEEVNTTQTKAYDAMQSIATGKVENLQEAVRTIEEAELTLKLGLEVKNKAIGAFKQVMAMQI